MNQVVCDVAVRTICVASNAPVNRSCKTCPVTQRKQNKWTGEASLRPGKSKMRSRVLWRHLEGIFFFLDAAWLNEGRCPGGRPSVSKH